MAKIWSALAVTAALFLSSCQTTQPSLQQYVGALNVTSIDFTAVGAIPPDSNVMSALPYFAKARMQARSSASGKPVDVDVLVLELHRKNPAAALLVGDANRLRAVISVTDDKGKLLIKREHTAMSNVVINGIIGAVVAAGANPAQVDQDLAKQMATTLEQSVFGASPERR